LRFSAGLAFQQHGWGTTQNLFGGMGPERSAPGFLQVTAALSEFGSKQGFFDAALQHYDEEIVEWNFGPLEAPPTLYDTGSWPEDPSSGSEAAAHSAQTSFSVTISCPTPSDGDPERRARRPLNARRGGDDSCRGR
jgi:hypothetical protein